MFLQEHLSSKIRTVSDAESYSSIDILKIISEWAEEEFQTDYEAQAKYIQNVTKTIKSQKSVVSNDQPHYTCGTRQTEGLPDTDAFDFLPVFAA
jgi:carbonic anhydrase